MRCLICPGDGGRHWERAGSSLGTSVRINAPNSFGEAGFPTSLWNQLYVECGGWGRVGKLRQDVWLSVSPAQNQEARQSGTRTRHFFSGHAHPSSVVIGSSPRSKPLPYVFGHSDWLRSGRVTHSEPMWRFSFWGNLICRMGGGGNNSTSFTGLGEE